MPIRNAERTRAGYAKRAMKKKGISKEGIRPLRSLGKNPRKKTSGRKKSSESGLRIGRR